MPKDTNPAPTEHRKTALASARNLKMARSAHAYVRGSTQKFYEWLDASKAKMPDGPAIWICGDCHSGNLGPVANAKGRIDIQIRDFDQTVIGNPAHDIIRLGLSLASAARGSDLPGVMIAHIIESLITGYDQAFADDEKSGGKPPREINKVLKFAMSRRWEHLARERIQDTTPTIPLGKRFWKLDRDERAAFDTLIADEKFRRLVTGLKSRDDDAPVEMLDAAYWIKGCSSLGLLRYAALVRVGGKGGDIALIDIKEATKALAPRAEAAAMPKDNAERVVTGAWHLSPYLGDRMLASRFLDRPVFVRELLPQDLKLEVDHLSAAEATKIAAFLGGIVGKAHARQMDTAARKAWRKDLAADRRHSLEAPNWLWSSVVELMATHEAAYLEHCRRYAIEKDAA